MPFYIHLNATFKGIIMLNQWRPFPTQYYVRRLAMQKVSWYGMRQGHDIHAVILPWIHQTHIHETARW